MLNIKLFFKFLICYIIAIPFIIYLLCNICISHRGNDIIKEYDSTDIFIMQTYKWNDGNYFMNQIENPNISKDCFGNNEYIYIRNISGRSPEKVLSKHITDMIETEILNNTCTVNAYRIEGKLSPTNKYCDGIKVFDLYINKLSVVSEVNRTNFADFLLPRYYLVIFDYKLFSNVLLDFVFILLCSIGIYIFIKKIISNISIINSKIVKEIFLIFFSIFLSVLIFVIWAWFVTSISNC